MQPWVYWLLAVVLVVLAWGAYPTSPFQTAVLLVLAAIMVLGALIEHDDRL